MIFKIPGIGVVQKDENSLNCYYGFTSTNEAWIITWRYLMSEIILRELSDRVVGLALEVHEELGPGLPEAAYEDAMCILLEEENVLFERQKLFPVYFHKKYIRAYIADLVVDNRIILELKSVHMLISAMEAQVINYLRLSKIQVGYLMNFFGTRLIFKRVVCT
jgi:GxxExxY protein